MDSKAQNMRQKVQQILDSNALHSHQINAAQKTFNALSSEQVRAVVTAAEMQAGKSGIALALCCLHFTLSQCPIPLLKNKLKMT